MVNKSTQTENNDYFNAENMRNLLVSIKAYFKAITDDDEHFENSAEEFAEIYQKSLYYAKPVQSTENNNPEFQARLNEAIKGLPYRHPDIEYFPKEDSPAK